MTDPRFTVAGTRQRMKEGDHVDAGDVGMCLMEIDRLVEQQKWRDEVIRNQRQVIEDLGVEIAALKARVKGPRA